MDIESRPVTVLKGVGPRLAEKLKRLGVQTVQDALFHLPFRYQDRTRVTAIGRLRPGREAVVIGAIELTDIVYRGKRSLLCRIGDGTGFLTLRFFYFNAAQQANLNRGRRLRCFGEVRFGPMGLEMVHPEYTLFDEHDTPQAEQALTPVYPATEGVHQLSIRKLTREAMDRSLGQIHEWLPEAVLQELQLPTLKDALATVHTPPADTQLEALETGRHPAQQRLAFEELLAHQLSMKRLRTRQQTHTAPVINGQGELMKALMTRLPFSLTSAQQRVLEEIMEDFKHAHPMHRLVQGDVGSGKTIVAAIAALHAIESGYQVAVMAPTELLAEQHLRNFVQWLVPLGVEVIALYGKLIGKARGQALNKLASPGAVVVVGTHALFQEEVEFADLGLMIVDEQHRFGVHQRLALLEKGSKAGRHPHQLVMTATPIPRTLAQTLYADLDVSVIDELPPGRQPVETVVVSDSRRAEVVQRVRSACLEGRQAYWVCPLIDESDVLQLQAATDTEAVLRETLPELKISLVHGRMKAAEKDKIMDAFKANRMQLLVATTVIEVGVDVPNASVMVIENAERLGLSQLHQLRGRVGRGSEKSSCVLMYQMPLSQQAKTRLAVMRETNDGFEIARRDLEMRGPGEMLGTRQTGLQEFHIADLMRDQALLPRVQQTADLLHRQYPQYVDPIIRRWLGQAEDYGKV